MDHASPQPTTALPYGTPETPRVAVRGEARLEVDPEIAHLGITVSARGSDRRTALEDLTRRNAQVLDLVKSYGQAVEKLETGAFAITPQLTAKGRHERIHAYHGRVHLSVTIADFTALGELSTRLADLELTQVIGPSWALRPDSPAHAEARWTPGSPPSSSSPTSTRRTPTSPTPSPTRRPRAPPATAARPRPPPPWTSNPSARPYTRRSTPALRCRPRNFERPAHGRARVI